MEVNELYLRAALDLYLKSPPYIKMYFHLWGISVFTWVIILKQLFSGSWIFVNVQIINYYPTALCRLQITPKSRDICTAAARVQRTG